MISSTDLRALIFNTASFAFEGLAPVAEITSIPELIEAAESPTGFLSIISGLEPFRVVRPKREEDHLRYFALCVAAHHCTVATFVATDVDSKIRGSLWDAGWGRDVYRAMFQIAALGQRWTVRPISRRYTECAGLGPVSGHDGEWLSVLAGALGAFIREGDREYADRAEACIDAELQREVAEFEFARSQSDGLLDLLRISMSITHNVGDLDQGISYWPEGSAAHQGFRSRYSRLGHENKLPYGGVYQVAKKLYAGTISAEGHRQYPLREPRGLRHSADVLLPLGPMLDDWGKIVAKHPSLAPEDLGEVVSALLQGCKKIPGQRGYFRALAGIVDARGGRLDDFGSLLNSSARQFLKDPTLRRQVAVSQGSFEASLKKSARQVLTEFV